ncbi:MAG: hypothetical protein FWG17_05370 [Desulfovibrionaceae bacterium]|nr:hypothetical protein [Desulfovibrionaceae bacterium]
MTTSGGVSAILADEIVEKAFEEERLCDGCIIRKNPNSPHVLFVFCAIDVPFGAVPGGNNLFVAEKLDANIVILNDRKKIWYLEGIEGLGTDMHSTAARLAEIRNTLLQTGGIALTYGNSMGAFGACLYGALLNVDMVIAPGAQLLAPNPVGVFQHYAGKRIDIKSIMASSSAFFHLLVGECFLGDIIGCLLVMDLPNVYIQTVRNFEHSVTGYMQIRHNIIKIINKYIKITTYRKQKNLELDKEIGVFFINLVDSRDSGYIICNKYAALYIYTTEIMLKYKKGNHIKRLHKMIEISNNIENKVIKSYIYYYIAMIFYSFNNKTRYLQRIYNYAEKGFILNNTSLRISQFLSTFCYTQKWWEKCLYWSQMAIACRHGDMARHFYHNNLCYAEQVESLRQLGATGAARIVGEQYKIATLNRTLNRCIADYAALSEAVERCGNKDIR